MSDSEQEMETGGPIDWPAIQSIEEGIGTRLDLPSLGLHVLMELIQWGFIIFFYAALSFMPELYIITVNRYFWTKVIIEVILLIMGWLFIFVNMSSFYKGLVTGEGRRSWLVGGTGTIAFIVYVLLNILSIGYSVMFLIWGGIDVASLPAGYQRTWMIIILVVVFLEIIVIILETILIGYYLRKMVFYFNWSAPAMAASRAKFLLNTAGKEEAEKYLRKTYDPSMIRTLEKMGDGGNLLPKKKKTGSFWKRSDVKFYKKQADKGALIV